MCDNFATFRIYGYLRVDSISVRGFRSETYDIVQRIEGSGRTSLLHIFPVDRLNPVRNMF